MTPEQQVKELSEALEAVLPSRLCGESYNLPDSEHVAIDITFGKLKQARAALAKVQQNEGGDWIEWRGGICPVSPDTIIDYRLRWFPTGKESFRAAAGCCRWDHGRTPEGAADPSLRRSDIIAYRVVPA